MYCQKCRTPLKLDSSLEDLNPAAYDLLVATASQSPSRKRPLVRPSNTPDADRRALYDQVSKNAGPATFKRHVGGGGSSSARTDGSQRDNSAMSFVLLSDSTVVSPPDGSGGGSGSGNRRGAGLNGRAFHSGGGSAPWSPPRRSAAPVHDSSNNSSSNNDNEGADSDGGQGDHSEETAAKAQGMERVTKLFELLSARSDVDHPVCVECTELLVKGLQQRLEAATVERDAYVAFLKKTQADVPTAEEEEAQAAALARARADEAAAMAELLRLEADKAALDDAVAGLEAEARALDGEEEQFWRARNAFATRLADVQNERDSLAAKADHDARVLERLQRSNVYNDTFCISHDGTFATINGLRLGRLSARPVDWPEINAAWGHALLLLVTVADKLRYRFEHYEPVPMGSTSRIVRYEPVAAAALSGSHGSVVASSSGGPPPAPKKQVLELYSSGDMPLGLTFMHRRFDNAMVAFLELVRQLGVFVHRQTAADGQHPLSLPYRIEGDKIGDVSIKLGIAQDDGWTKACKLTLTCCKFLLAHASNVNSAAARGS